MSGDCIELVDLLKSFNDSLKDGSFPNKDGNTNKSNTLFSFSKNPHTNTSSSSEKDTDSNVVNSEEQTQGKFITCFTDYIQERRSFILDLSYLLYYGYFRSNSQVWQDTAFVIEIITAILSRGHEVYIAVDGKPVRKQMDKHYKENRKHTYNIRENMPPLLAELNMHKRIHIHYNPELEADDVIYTLNALLPGKKVIVTSDNDMLQCLGCDTIIDMGKQVVDIASYPKQFEEKFHNVQISKLPMYRAIVGDSSDNIRAAIPRFPHKLAARFVSSLDMNLDKFPSHDALEESRKQFIQKEKVSESENAWIERLLSLEIPKKKEKKKNESKNEETQSTSETDEDVMSLLPEELRPVRLVDITTSNNANAKKASHKTETDEDDDIPRSNFSRWQDNFALMKLHAYSMDEISMEPKMEFDAMPSEIDNLFMKMRKAHSLFQSMT